MVLRLARKEGILAGQSCTVRARPAWAGCTGKIRFVPCGGFELAEETVFGDERLRERRSSASAVMLDEKQGL